MIGIRQTHDRAAQDISGRGGASAGTLTHEVARAAHLAQEVAVATGAVLDAARGLTQDHPVSRGDRLSPRWAERIATACAGIEALCLPAALAAFSITRPLDLAVVFSLALWATAMSLTRQRGASLGLLLLPGILATWLCVDSLGLAPITVAIFGAGAMLLALLVQLATRLSVWPSATLAEMTGAMGSDVLAAADAMLDLVVPPGQVIHDRDGA